MTTTRTALRAVLPLAIGLTTAARAADAQDAGRVTVLTRAERTQYRETSSYHDVLAFLRQVANASPIVHLTTFGYTMEGRALPLAIVTNGDTSASAIAASGKLRVFVQADIHAGEVCGKEAMQILLRDVADGRHRDWLDSVILLIAPIYNADGNERVELTNRPRQHGPVGGMGRRPNAQGLDLNRDHMKLDSPEALSLVGLMRRYDPHVLLDLHTTDGSRVAYYLEYAEPLHPDTDRDIIELLRGSLLPEVTKTIKAEHGWDYYYYGNLPFRGSVERGWYTYDYRPRYNTNYVGLRNRIGILSEAYAYDTFEDRVRATRWFVEEVIDWAYRHATRVRQTVVGADARSIVGRDLALRATLQRSADSATILLGEVEQERNPYSGAVMLRRTDAAHPERMPEFVTFRAEETEPAPSAYIVPGDLDVVRVKLDQHGIRYDRAERDERRTVERFVIDSTQTAEREYQGHRERVVFGRYERADVVVPAGAILVPMDQPLARLAFQLLEPRAADGLVDWSVLDRTLEGAPVYPILRVPAP